jgi:ATP-dependent DNA helicase RecG
MTTDQELMRWIESGIEDEHLEFKEAKNQYDTDKALRYCVAIANEGGGKLILGVTDRIPRRVVGTHAFLNPHVMQSKILDKFRMRVEIEEVTHTDRRVLIFHIPSRPIGTAYQFEGAYLMRSGEDTVPMTEDRLRHIFDEGKPNWLLRSARDNVTNDDIVRLLDTQSYFDLMRIPYPENRQGVIDRFVAENFVVHTAAISFVTNLGALLFAKRLLDFDGLMRKTLRVIVYDSTNKLRTRLDREATKGYAVGFEEQIDFINGLIPSNEIIGRALRSEVKMFPEIAVRELVANALIHQDFGEIGTSVMIELYKDRLEISSPGKPFISPERFIDEYQSRNEKLADVMRRLRICEEKGSGIDKVVHSAEMFQLPPPDFRVGEKHTVAVLFAYTSFDRMDRTARIRACYQHCCLRYLMNQKMTNQSLRERFGLQDPKAETVSRIIRDSIQEDFIKLEDPNSTSKRYARYLPFWA